MLVFVGVCWAGGTLGKPDFLSCLGVGGRQSTEPSPGGLCCVAALVPEAFPRQVGSSVAVRTAGSASGIQRPCIAKGDQYGEVSREKSRPPVSVAVPGFSLTHRDVAGRAMGLLARGSRRCPTGHTGCAGAWRVPCVVRGHVGMALAQLRWEGVVSPAWRGLDAAWQLQSREVPAPRVGGGTDAGNHCLQALLCGGDIPLPASVISDGGKTASEFYCSCSGSSRSSPAPQPCGGQGSSGQPLLPGFAWLFDKMRVNVVFLTCREKVRIRTSTE